MEAGLARLLIGDSLVMRRLRAVVIRLAHSDAPVLIDGPTGSGKELVAEALHRCSGRTGAFVPFNVCAIGDGMFESAIFGHVRGAFTGALNDAPGYLTEAHEGTVFFDEIGSLALPAQAKLLRALETRTFRPVGDRRDRRSNFRVVAGTNEELAALVAAGRFREDLMHRLRALVVRVPSLRDRREDIPQLVAQFLARARPGAGAVFTGAAIARLVDHDWRGNVRELRNVVEFALALCDDARIDESVVDDVLETDGSRQPIPAGPGDRQQLLQQLEACAWDTARLAASMGLHRSNIYRMMGRLGIQAPRRRGRGTSPAGSLTPPDEFALFARDGANSR